MPEAIETGWIHRLRYTPMRDVLRGQFTGRLNFRLRVGAWLPAEASNLIIGVVKHTHLRRMEKLDVADELVAHFADGLDRGTPLSELIASFGNERVAAKLIARAKRRSRPPIVRAFDALGWTLSACACAYVLLAIWFYIGRPSPSVDYLPTINHDALATDPSQRAWPVYSAAQREIKSLRATAPGIIYEKAGAKYWPLLVDWLKLHQRMLDGMRRASQLPQIGFIFGPGGTQEQATASEGSPAHREDSLRSKTDGVYSIEDVTSNMRELLLADARVAIAQREGSRFLADIQAMLNMADQAKRIGISGGQWPSPFFWFQANRTVSLTVSESPDIFTDAQLAQLAHLLSGPQVAADLRGSMKFDRLFFYDAIQRCYTDDGHGGGRLTPAAMDQFYHGGVEGRAFYLGIPWIGSYAEWPAALLSGGSRREIVQKYDDLMDRIEAQLRLPRRLADWSFMESLPCLDAYSSPVHGNQMILEAFVNSGWASMHAYYERRLGERDGALVAIALEIYHRQHGSYPNSLAALTPDLLPTIPADRITGDLVHYRLINGNPVIYSVGDDRKDDNATTPIYKGQPSPWSAARWGPRQKAIPGDWVLYPEQRDPDGD